MPSSKRKTREHLQRQYTQIDQLEAEAEGLKAKILRLTGERDEARVDLRVERARVEELRASTDRGK